MKEIDEKDEKQEIVGQPAPQETEKKLTNLCEDMRPHTHNQDEYDKMKQDRESK